MLQDQFRKKFLSALSFFREFRVFRGSFHLAGIADLSEAVDGL